MELQNIVTGCKAAIMEKVLHWRLRTGVGQIDGFTKDIANVRANSERKLDDLAVKGVNVTATRAAIVAMATDAVDAAVAAGKVELQ